MRAARLGRRLSTSAVSGLVQVERSASAPVATLSLNRPPANSISLELAAALRSSLAELEADPTVRGVVLSSTSPKIFCSGLDFAELVNPEPTRLHAFWTEMQLLSQDLFLSPLATVASMRGHAPAGGTILALACDARVLMAGGPRIGLNEAQLGLAPPWWICDLMTRCVGDVASERMLTRGSLVMAEEAAELGLVDTAPDSVQGLEQAVQLHMKQMLAVPDAARREVKAQRRRRLGDEMKARTAEGSDAFVAAVLSPPLQATLQAYMESLAKKK